MAFGWIISLYAAAKRRFIGALRDDSPQQAQHENGAGDIEQGEIHATSGAPRSPSTPATGADQLHETSGGMLIASLYSSTTSRQRRWSRPQRKAVERFAYMTYTASAGGLYNILSARISANEGDMHILSRLYVVLLAVASVCSAIIVLLVKLCHRYRYFDTIIKAVIFITSATVLLSVILGCLLFL